MRKHIVFILVVLACLLAFTACSDNSQMPEPALPTPTVSPDSSDVPVPEATDPVPSEDPEAGPIDKYLNDDNVKQIVTVMAVSQTDAHITLYEKSEVNGANVWTETLSCDGYIGKNGLGKTKEGDGMTPIGDFGIITAFGIKENPGTVLPYVDVTEDIYCCGDENFYNQIIDIKEHPHDCNNGEHMIDYCPQYNYGFFLDYNSECIVGKGSAIFFHCCGSYPYTGGCIAVSEENMVTILNALDINARIIVDYSK